jgi:hypothetical protein
MMTAKVGIDHPLNVQASLIGVAVYLDNFALLAFAKGDPERRRRLIAAFHAGADLGFSVTNAAELVGPQGRSLDQLRMFLDEIGAHWFPLELSAHRVVTRELGGATPGDSCIAEDFMKQYFAARTKGYTPGSGKIISMSDAFFSLGAVLDWLVPERDPILANAAKFDDVLIQRIDAYRKEFERDPRWLDEHFPSLPFNPSKPATFTYTNLVRTLVLEAKQYKLKKGDGRDFSHAVMGSAFASVATLDKQWKRRIESLPKPNQLARIYYEPELDRMVSDIESALESSLKSS